MIYLHSLPYLVILLQCYQKCMATKADNCRQLAPVLKFSGYKCLMSSSVITLSLVTLQRCQWECLRRSNCTITNYNVVDNVCILTRSPCNTFASVADSIFTSFGPYSEESATTCLRWAPVSEFDQSVAVRHPVEIGQFVGRILLPSHTLPGSYDTSPERFKSVLNNREVTLADGPVEFMKVDCNFYGWTPYTAGDPIPDKAIVGGFTSAGSVALLYVAAGGYYNPQDGKGYTTTPTVTAVTQMKLLIPTDPLG